MRDATRLRHQLVDVLRGEGALTDPRWLAAFRAVPRHAFLSRFFLPQENGWAATERGDDGWLETVYSRDVLVTQLDDDPSRWAAARADGPVQGTPTCSSSMPSIMAIMLEELLVEDGQRVLEIGTGTGYNTALLCHRVGDSNMSTVDIDPGLVATATDCLTSCGFAPTCSASDGAQGFPIQAPFDRVLCTCAVSTIPPTWLEQTNPGGMIVTTLHRPIGGGLLRIIAGKGATGQGRVLARDGRFMPLRAHRMTRPLTERGREAGRAARTSLPLDVLLNPATSFEFFAGLELPGLAMAGDVLLHPDGSWARHRTRDGQHVVEQGGPRRLWEIVERAHRDWRTLGRPPRDRFGITIAGDDQRLWLDSPDGRHWPLAGGPQPGGDPAS